MTQMITLKSAASDGFEFGALHAQPLGERRGGVIVVQEIFGLNKDVQADVARWAALGFEVVAPSLFDRSHPGFIGEHTPEDMQAGFGHMQAVSPADVTGDLEACIDFLAPRGPVFAVGYCYGGSVVWRASAELTGLAAASSYYGSKVAEWAGRPLHNPVICHFGRKDTHIPAAEVEARIKAAHPEVPVYIYENSGHAFNNDGRADADPADAALARERTLALFVAHGAR